MEKHNGQITEYLVRKHGYNITDLAEKLDVNRRTIYNYFQNKHLKSDVMFKIGKVIRHDFSNEFPEYFTPEEFGIPSKRTSPLTYNSNIDLNEEDIWKNKYIDLLEKHSKLLINCVGKTRECCDNL